MGTLKLTIKCQSTKISSRGSTEQHKTATTAEYLYSSAMEGDGFGNGTTQVDTKVLQSFQRSFVQVQSILDQNRLLINEITQNQESRVPDGLTRNVGLIRELNNNIRRVVDLYADLSTNFSRSAEATAAASEDDSTVRSDPRASGGLKRNRPT